MARKAKGIDLLKAAVVTKLPSGSHFPLNVRAPEFSEEEEKIFNFDFLEPLGAFGRVLAQEFIEFCYGKAVDTADSLYHSIRLFFRFTLRNNAFEFCKRATEFSGAEWASCAELWADLTKANGSIVDTTINSYIVNVNGFLKNLISKRILPRFPLPRPIPRVKGKPIDSISQIKPLLVDHNGIDKSTSDTIHRLEKISNLSIPTQNLERINILLENLRHHAESEARRFWSIFNQTKEAVKKNTNFDVEAFRGQYESVDQSKTERKRGWRKPLLIKENLWKYIWVKYGGLIPHRDADPELARFIYNEVGQKEISCRFHSSFDSVIPFIVIIIIETAMNVSCALNLKFSNLKASLHAGKKELFWIKPRARYRELSSTLDTGTDGSLKVGSKSPITAAQAVVALNAMAASCRLKAAEKNADLICLTPRFHKRRFAYGPPEMGFIAKKFTEFRERSRLLKYFDFNLSNIRSTIALREFIKSGGDINRVKDVLEHQNPETSVRYTLSLASDTVNSVPVREVQDFLMLGATKDRKDVRAKMGLTKESASKIITAAHSKGFLGYDLSEDMSGDENKSKRQCSLFEKFLAGSKIIGIESPQMAAELIKFKEHLIIETRDMKEERSFYTLWAPLIVMINLALEEMSVRIRLAGEKLAAQYSIVYGEL